MTRPLLTLLLLTILAGCQSDPSRPITTAPPTAAPDTPQARQLNDRAFALIQNEKHAEAEPLVRKALDADVMFGPAHNNLGLIYFAHGDLYPAAVEFQNAIRLMPYQPEPRNNLGLVFERAGKPAEAIDAYERARKMQPDNPEFLTNLLRVKLARKDRDDQTRQLLQEVAFKDPRPAVRAQAQLDLIRLFTHPPAPSGPTTLPTPR